MLVMATSAPRPAQNRLRLIALALLGFLAFQAPHAQAGPLNGVAYATVPEAAVADAPNGWTALCQRDAVLCFGQAQPAERPSPGSVPNRLMSVADVICGATAMNISKFAICQSIGPARASLSHRYVLPQSLHVSAGRMVVHASVGHFGRPDRDRKAEMSIVRRLNRINRQVNRSVLQQYDAVIGTNADQWGRPTIIQNRMIGDCEDIALEKLSLLRAEGMAEERMRLAVVYSRQLGLHTVLVVRVNGEDRVLDSRTNRIVRWNRAGYSWLRIQSEADHREWRLIGRA